MEAAFPTGTLDRPTGQDLNYMGELLGMIEARGLPAPAPIEQRWSASSSSPMSPAYSTDLKTVHSWVGIIMYLPTDDEKQRGDISKAFGQYSKMVQVRDGKGKRALVQCSRGPGRAQNFIPFPFRASSFFFLTLTTIRMIVVSLFPHNRRSCTPSTSPNSLIYL
jgi:hypothetical protein